MKKLILVKNSDGQRGANGKKKIYEIVVIDNRVVIKIKNLSERPTVSRRRASYLHQLLPLL